MRGFASAIRDLAKVFRNMPGQKNIIYFSRGFGGNIFSPGSSNRDDFLDMSKELAAANSPVFSVNTATGMARMGPPSSSLQYLSRLSGGKYFDSVDQYSAISEDIQTVSGSVGHDHPGGSNG